MKKSEFLRVKRVEHACTGLPSDNNHDPSNIIRHEGRYYLWYTQHMNDRLYDDFDNCLIMMTSSPDGVSWTEGIPALLPSEKGWDDGGVLTASIFRYDGKYCMWYTGVEKGFDGKRICASVAVADSPEGPFTRISSEPLLTPGSYGSWDDRAVDDVSTIYFRGRWMTYYKGTSYMTPSPDHTHIGVAVSGNPFGPYEKIGEGPLLRGHAFSVWPYQEGLLLLSGLKDKDDEGYMYRGDWHDPKGHQYLYRSNDGFSFEPVCEFENRASGIFVPDDTENSSLSDYWGVSVNTNGTCFGRYIERFDFAEE